MQGSPNAGAWQGAAWPSATAPRPFYVRRALGLAPWAALALLSTVQSYVYNVLEGQGHTFAWAFLTHAPPWLAWAALAPLVTALGRRVRLEPPLRGGRVALHALSALAASVVFAGVYVAANRLATPSAYPYSAAEHLGRALLGYLPITVLTYGAVVGVSYALEYALRARDRERRADALEAQLVRSQLDALRAQLHPHFLFNALHTVAVLVREHDTATAVRTLARLGDVLRSVLRTSATHEVTLRDEIAFLKEYLAIEMLRFGDRLRVSWPVDEGALGLSVPHLVLQPLVENALRHGIARRAAAGRLAIGARVDGARLELSVEDDGPGLEGGVEPDASEGFGLGNTRQRLATLYGARAALSLAPGDSGGVRAVVTLPADGGREGARGGAP